MRTQHTEIGTLKPCGEQRIDSGLEGFPIGEKTNNVGH
jgi:hypothetical protein